MLRNRAELKSLLKLFFSILIFLLIFPVFVEGVKIKRDPIYDPGLDVKAAITESLEIGKKENKNILVMFGGNWCPWCYKLHSLFEKDLKINDFLKKNYILILVDIGETAAKPLNRDIVDKLRVKGFGYPSLAVLGYQKGTLLAAQSTGILEKGKSHDAEKVLGFLKAQAPNPKK